MTWSARYNRLLYFAVIVVGGVALGRMVPSINNPWSIVLGVVAVVLGALVYRRRGFYGLLVMHAWLLWYPLVVQPLSTIGGPLTRDATLAELVFVVAGALVALRTFVRPKDSALGAAPAVWVLLVSAGWLLTISVAPASLTLPSLRHVLYYLLLLVLCAEFVKTSSQAWGLIWGVMVSLMIQHGVVFWGQHLGGLPFYSVGLGSVQQDVSRLHGVYTLPGAMPVEVWGSRASGLLAMVAAILLLTALYGPRRNRTAVLSLFTLTGAMLLFTGGRAGWLGFILGLTVVLIVAIRSVHLSTLRGAVSIATVGGLAAVVYAATGFLNADFWSRAVSLGAVTQESSWISRLRFWRLATDLLIANPFGIGFDTLLARYGVFEHNAFLWLVNGAGPLGLATFCAVWGLVAFRSAVLVKSGSRETALIGAVSLVALTVVLVAGTAENTPFLSEGAWIVWGAAIGVESSSRRHTAEEGSAVS